MKNLLLCTADSINWGTVYGGELLTRYAIVLAIISLFVWLLGTNRRSQVIYFSFVLLITFVPLLIMWWFINSAGELEMTAKTTGKDIANFLKQPLQNGIITSVLYTIGVALFFSRSRNQLNNDYRELNERMLAIVNNLSLIVAVFGMLASMLSIFTTLLTFGEQKDKANLNEIMVELTETILSDTVLLFIILIAVANLSVFGTIVNARIRNSHNSE